MAYSPAAKALRRCVGTTKRGEPCSVWGDPSQRCIVHGGRARPSDETRDDHRARVEPCHCLAYEWPHRPGSDLCRWPDPATHRSTTPASTHQWPSRFRSRMRRVLRGTQFAMPIYLLRPEVDPLDDPLWSSPDP